jgi:hypothetical protein
MSFGWDWFATKKFLNAIIKASGGLAVDHAPRWDIIIDCRMIGMFVKRRYPIALIERFCCSLTIFRMALASYLIASNPSSGRSWKHLTSGECESSHLSEYRDILVSGVSEIVCEQKVMMFLTSETI